MNENERKEEEKKLIEEMLEYFSENKLDPKNEKEIQKIQKTLANIMKMEIDKLGLEIKFNPEKFDSQENDVVLNFAKDEDEIKCLGSFSPHGKNNKKTIKFNLEYFVKNLEDENTEKRLDSCYGMFHTLFHELRHHQQYLMMSQGVSSKENLLFGKDWIVLSYLNSFYKQNYDSYVIENDANLNAAMRYGDIMGVEDNDLVERSKILYDGELSTGRYKLRIINKNGKEKVKKYERDDATEIIVEHIICEMKDKGAFEIAPILSKEYNFEDCTRKSLAQLLDEMRKEKSFLSRLKFLQDEEKEELVKESKEMYYEIIGRSLEHLEEGELADALMQSDVDEMVDLFNDMDDYFFTQKEEQKIKAENMYMVQTTPGKVPSIHFIKENPLKKFNKKSGRIEDTYNRKSLSLKQAKIIVREINYNLNEMIKPNRREEFLNYLRVTNTPKIEFEEKKKVTAAIHRDYEEDYER